MEPIDSDSILSDAEDAVAKKNSKIVPVTESMDTEEESILFRKRPSGNIRKVY